MLKNTVIHGRMIHSNLYPSSDAVPQGSHQYARYASGAGSHVCCAGAPPVVVVLHKCSRLLPFRVTIVSILSQHQLWPHQLQAGTPSDEDRSCTEPREVACCNRCRNSSQRGASVKAHARQLQLNPFLLDSIRCMRNQCQEWPCNQGRPQKMKSPQKMTQELMYPKPCSSIYLTLPTASCRSRYA